MEKGMIILPDTYNYRLTCDNCSFSMGLHVPLGITVHKYAEDHTCSNCGCKLFNPLLYQSGHYPVSPMIYLPYRRE